MRVYRAPGKLFWLGEYAVLDGAPAVVAAVDRHAVIRVEEAGHAVRFGDDGAVLWTATGATPALDGAELALVAAVRDTLHEAGIRPPPCHVHADSAALTGGHGQHLEQKLGLGSSGAVAAGLVAALAPALDVESGVALALAAHSRFQNGRGSGGDVAASSWGGLVTVGGGSVAPVGVPKTLQFAALAVGVPADTRARIDVYRAWTRGEEGRAVAGALAACARDGLDALRGDDVSAWLACVRRYAELERAMTRGGVDVIPDVVSGCIDAAERAGWAAKPSGAGGGDVVVAFAGPGGEREALRTEVERAGYHLIDLALEAAGVLNDGTRERRAR